MTTTTLTRLIIVSISLFLLLSCNNQSSIPIKIGFMGTLTGHASYAGDAARDAVIMAIEQLNNSGGIGGQRVELVIKDIQQNPEFTRKTVNEFIAQNIPAVIGPMFSSMSVAAAEAANNGDVLLISPTSSTTLLNNKDDNFFRIYPPSNVAAEKLADHVIEKPLKSISIIWDIENKAFTEDWKDYFVRRYNSLGGLVAGTFRYEHKKIHYIDLIKAVLEGNPSSVLILSNAFETAMFCQQLAKLGSNIPVFASEWSMTEGVIENGGKAVEGIEFFHVLNASSSEKAYLDFIEAYLERYKRQPSYPAILAFEAAQVVIEGLRQGARTGSQLKQALLQKESIDVLQTNLRFNEFGEVQRKFFLNTVRDKRIVSVQN